MPREFGKIQGELVDALLQIPDMLDFANRSLLLDDLPPVGLNRSQNARLDLLHIISGLHKLGRLDDRGGARPLLVVMDNGLAIYGVTTGAVADKLTRIRSELQEFYRGEIQSPLAAPPQAELEQLIFGRQRDTRLAFSFVEGLVRVTRAVARLRIPRIVGGSPDEMVSYGTGWLIAPGLLITNHHVIEVRDHRPKPYGLGDPPAERADVEAQVKAIVARFDYHREIDKQLIECHGAAIVADDLELDYAIVELTEGNKVSDRTTLPVVRRLPPLQLGSRLNIVQHSQGGPMQLAIRNNFYVSPGNSDAFIRYQTDTEPGASGSPVCDDNWHVVALHHSSVNVPADTVPQEVVSGRPVEVTVLNEAITLDAILRDLPESVRQRIDAAQSRN